MTRPNFLLCGAAKSGTTTLWEFLRAHPQVWLPEIKEVNYFVDDAWYSRQAKGWAWYQNLFEARPGVTAYGEASVNYLTRPEAAGLIHRRLPDAQLIFILRNPADRLYSHYTYDRQLGYDLPDFETLYRQRPAYWDEICSSSRYELHLPRFTALFPAAQMHVFLFDDLKDHPGSFIRSLYQSIGVDPDFTPPRPEAHANVTGQVRRAWLQKIIFGIEKATFGLSLPEPIRRPLSRVRLALRKANLQEQPAPRLDPALRQALMDEFSASAEYVEQYLRRSLTSWRSQ